MGIIEYNIPEGLCMLRSSYAYPAYPKLQFIVGPYVFENTTYDIVLSAGTLMFAKQLRPESDSVEYAIIGVDDASAYRDFTKSGGSIDYYTLANYSTWADVKCCESTTGVAPFSNQVTVSSSELINFISNLIGGQPTKGEYRQNTSGFTEQSGWEDFAYEFPDTWTETHGNVNNAQMPYFMLAPVVYGGTIPAQSYPITYRLTNATTTGPNEAAVGDTVTVPLAFPEGYGVVNPSSDAYVTCNGVLVPSTYSNGQLVFTMPDPS